MRKKIRTGERKKKEREKMLNNYYDGVMNEIAMDLVLNKKQEQMEFYKPDDQKGCIWGAIWMNPIWLRSFVCIDFEI